MELIVSRDSGYADKLRAYVIFVDGKKVGTIRNGETQKFPIATGAHVICAGIDWCKTDLLRFTVSDGESPAFQVRSNLRGSRLFLALWYALVARNQYLLLQQLPDSSVSNSF